MIRSIRTRLDRMERARPATNSNQPPMYFWEVISGAKNADELSAGLRARLDEFWAARREESKGYRIAAVRRLLDLLGNDFGAQGVPTAGELVDREDRERGFCVIEELLRILPSSQKAGR